VSDYIHKSHNVSVLLYHVVFPAKYRRIVFGVDVENALKEICLEISKRYEVRFIEIGVDKDHVHFLIQSVPMYSATKLVTLIKSITAKELFKLHPEIKKILWGSSLWTSGYFISTVSKHGSEEMIQKYVQGQGGPTSYTKLHSQQLDLFL
jgi:REP element-mobilizing transposase RayT